MAEVESRTEKQAAGATKLSEAGIKGKIVEYLWYLKKQGYSESTIVGRSQLLQRLIKLKANLYDPETVKDIIAKQEKWSEGRKSNAVYAYTGFLKWLGGKWRPPRYEPEEKLPFIPLERELDDLISGCSLRISCYLQLLKESAWRAGEAWRLEWTDIDFANNIITLNKPEKRSKPRQFKASFKLMAMLNNLRNAQNPMSERVFNYVSTASMRRVFERQRKRIAHKTANPRILKISFHTFRHWKATMEYHKTKDILYVMKVLGHKSIKNTLRYTQLVNPGEDEYVSKVAKTIDEARVLVEAGFEYVCDVEDAKLFRKRK